MVDAVGTTIHARDAAGKVLSEDGPWTVDAVSCSYHNHRRMGLSVTYCFAVGSGAVLESWS